MQRYEALRGEKALQPLSNIERIVDGNSLLWNKSRDTIPFKPAMFENNHGKQSLKENVFPFKLEDSKPVQNVMPFKAGLTPRSSEVCSEKESIELSSFEEECDMSGVSLPEYVTQLYKYENQQNYGSPMIWDDSLNDSQDSLLQAWKATKALYDYAEYSKDVYQYLRQSEIRFQPRLSYMREQPHIDSRMRSILVDWLVEVANEYQFENETLHLAVSLVDRFLSVVPVAKTDFQLLGATSMLIAAKYEESGYPPIEELAYISGDFYSKRQFLEMEYLILKTLDFNVTVPTVYWFLRYICCATDMADTVLFLAQYLCELVLLEAEPFFQFLPSQIAAAAISLSNYTMGSEPWDSELEQTTGYKFEDLTNTIDSLYAAYHNYSQNHLQAIRQKYKANEYSDVSSITPPEKLCF